MQPSSLQILIPTLALVKVHGGPVRGGRAGWRRVVASGRASEEPSMVVGGQGGFVGVRGAVPSFLATRPQPPLKKKNPSTAPLQPGTHSQSRLR